MSLDTYSVGRTRGSALMIALFVIVVMALLAAALGRLLVDSGEKNTMEVRSVRAQLAAQSGLEVALYQLFPNRPVAPSSNRCSLVATTLQFDDHPGLAGCQVAVSCSEVSVTYNNQSSTGYRLQSAGSCGANDLASDNQDFRVSRTVTAEAYDEALP
ncbi:MAG: MSHA biogenesis protein MshP [Aeromonas sp.]